MTDAIIETMLLLKNNWSLMGDLAAAATINSSGIHFSTRLYNENITFPQIVIIPAGEVSSPPLDCGLDPTYRDLESVGFEIYIRPTQDSNSSLGWAKNAIYQLRRETERILRSGSILKQDDDKIEKFLYLTGWRRMDNLSIRPPLLILSGHAYIVKHNKGVTV
jgi:hypothetical protein